MYIASLRRDHKTHETFGRIENLVLFNVACTCLILIREKYVIRSGGVPVELAWLDTESCRSLPVNTFPTFPLPFACTFTLCLALHSLFTFLTFRGFSVIVIASRSSIEVDLWGTSARSVAGVFGGSAVSPRGIGASSFFCRYFRTTVVFLSASMPGFCSDVFA